MAKALGTLRARFTPMTWFVILSVIAVGLALGLPPDQQTVHNLHTTDASFRVALAALLIPYVIIWYAGFYAFAKLREYSRPLKNTKDGAAFHKITLGMGTLAFSLVVPAILSLILDNIAQHRASFSAASIIITNYIYLFPSLIAFLLLYNGALLLADTVRGTVRHFDIRWQAPWFFLLCIVFSHLTIQNQYQHKVYHLSVWLLVVTYIVPYLYAWMVGLLCAYSLHAYANTVTGVLYRSGVRQLANGVAITIIASLAIQFLNVTIAKRISTLATILLLDYALLVVIAAGLLLMALGTKKLKRLEEV